jgi:hypothetical protein
MGWVEYVALSLCIVCGFDLDLAQKIDEIASNGAGCVRERERGKK